MPELKEIPIIIHSVNITLLPELFGGIAFCITKFYENYPAHERLRRTSGGAAIIFIERIDPWMHKAPAGRNLFFALIKEKQTIVLLELYPKNTKKNEDRGVF